MAGAWTNFPIGDVGRIFLVFIGKIFFDDPILLCWQLDGSQLADFFRADPFGLENLFKAGQSGVSLGLGIGL